MASLRLATALLATATATACGQRAPLPDQVTTTKWMKYHHWPDEPPCRDALDHLDAMIDFIAGHFAIRPGPIDYYKYRPEERALVSAFCQHGASACAEGKVAYTRAWSHDHEVVHTVLDQIGNPPQLFVEGIAVIMGCGTSGYAGMPVDPATPLERLVSSDAWDTDYPLNGGANYAAAGSFTRWLLDHHGAAAFIDFYARAPHHGGDKALDTFASAFGVTLGDALAQWRASNPPPVGSQCLLGADPCSAAPPLDPSREESLTRELSCVPMALAIAAGLDDALGVAVSSSELPITLGLESCGAQPESDAYLIPPETLGALVTATQHLKSVGRDAELRAYGLGARGRLRLSPSREGDLTGAFNDPEGSPFGGAWGGEVTFKSLPPPPAPFRDTCPPAALPLGANTWLAQLSGPLAQIPPDGGAVVLHGAPFRLLSQYAYGALPDWGCGSPCAADAGSCTGPVTDTYMVLTPPPVPTYTRFSVGWIVER